MPQAKGKKSVLVTVSIIVLIIAISAVAYRQLGAKTEVILPRKGPVVEAVYGLGTVIAPKTYQLKTAVNQVISKIFVKEGDHVKAGDPLIQFADSGSQRAPFDGTITAVPFKVGELIFPAVSAVTVVNLSDLYLEVSLEQQAVLRVRQGQKATVSFESLRNEKLEGEVLSVFPRDNQFIVRINLQKFPEGVLPGMTADVAIEVGRKDNALTVPLRAISGGKITLKRDGKTLKEDITIGVVDGQWAEVTSGNLNPDDEIYVRSK